MIYAVAPTGSVRRTDVAAVLLLTNSGNLLLLQRANDKPFAGRWGLPCGKREPNESLVEAAIRETREETGFHLRSSDLASCPSLLVGDERSHFLYQPYVTPLPFEMRPTLNPKEHSAYAWVTPRHALRHSLVEDGKDSFRRLFSHLRIL